MWTKVGGNDEKFYGLSKNLCRFASHGYKNYKIYSLSIELDDDVCIFTYKHVSDHDVYL